MAFRMNESEWENIKNKSTGSYTSDEEAKKSDNTDKERLEDELDDEKMRRQQEKAERERRKSEREDRKFTREHPGSDFARKYNKLHPKSEQPKTIGRVTGKKISKGTRKAVSSPIQPIGVPKYTSPSFNIRKSGYTPLDYKPMGSYSYSPIFGSRVPMPKTSKGSKSSKPRVSHITGFTYF
jgi:hypothetical protein